MGGRLCTVYTKYLSQVLKKKKKKEYLCLQTSQRITTPPQAHLSVSGYLQQFFPDVILEHRGIMKPTLFVLFIGVQDQHRAMTDQPFSNID